MTVYILSSEAGSALTKTIEKKIRSAIADLGVIDDVVDIAKELGAAGRVKKVIIAPFTNIESIDKLIDMSGRYREQAFFILVSKEISASNYKRLLRSGGLDWTSADASVQEILEIISRQRPTLSDAGAQSKKPTVVAFLPSAGGVGNTTIALEVAIQSKVAKASRPWRTCYVDLDFQTSHACDFLDLEPRLQFRRSSISLSASISNCSTFLPATTRAGLMYLRRRAATWICAPSTSPHWIYFWE